MATPPRSTSHFSAEQRPSQDLLSSSPQREAATKLLSSSPSIPPFFGRAASHGSSVNGDGQTPVSSWRSPSTLQNYRSNDATASNDAFNSAGQAHRSGLDSSSNSISGSYVGSPAYLDSINSIVDIPADEASKVVKKHLVLNSPSRDSFDSDRNGAGSGGPSGSNGGHHDGAGTGEVVDYTTAFKLPGGAITRDVYKWQADQENEQNRRARSRSFHLPRPVEPSVTTLKQPGGMRRYHMIMKAEASGRQANVFTKSFIDFLAMYGHFAGEDLDDDEGGDFVRYDEEDAQGGGAGSGSGTGGTESTPLIPKSQQAPQGDATPAKAVFLLLKSFVGTGIMFLPKAFNNGGILFSSVVLVAIAGISLFSFLLLVESRQVVPASFGDIGGHLYGPYMRQAVLWSIAISQVGFVCAYMSFVATNLEALARNVLGATEMYPSYIFVLAQLIVFIPLALIRNIARLSFTAVVADVFICFGLIYMYYFDIFTLSTNGLSDVSLFNPKDFALFIGTAVFTFEGIGLIIPITESMKEPKKFPKVLTGVMIGITILFTSFAALSYATFGSKTETVVLLNLPQKSHWVQSVQVLYSIAIMLSIPLQLFPAIRIMENGIFTRSGKYNTLVKWQKNFFRVLSLLGCAAIAIWAGEDLDKFVSIVGSVACIPLAYIFPAMFHYKTHPNRKTRIIDVMLVIFGVVTMVYTTGNTIYERIRG
ncbi:transmembrane amino acid transporter protein-domain-containing protein [Gamsiella multidivaricata]|uniref:transmembrane amino acid transporter protein-domain-containing protein n=1 Tax=Gamsiella multidivaricata TaxID=101098 RepID=UPI00221F68C1|nr:transmembrane amino acid transporter protein-domain-containing protein [Gamsiella multidivaricata]KAG0368017.1 neutral amino acid transporter [Gamsiella multidivaricata]KAI7830571.1 transmembrane amino acid transporter protein-domain-containing protein [Gamsiella multidivaricata]